MENRKIKIRVWSIESKCWMNHCAILDCRWKLGSHFFELDDKGKLICQHIVGLDNTKFIIQQYTGLKDKNNRELYEGDIILSYDKNYYECIYDSERLTYRWKNINCNKPIEFNNNYQIKQEIVGNFLENPELFK